MMNDKQDFTDETSIEVSNDDEDLEKIYRELENESFTTDDQEKNPAEEVEEDVEIVDDKIEENPQEVDNTLDEVNNTADEATTVEEVTVVEEVKEESNKKKSDKKDKKKGKIKWQTIFNCISVLFIVGCLIFYGIRAFKYYKIYNPKAENGEKLVSLGAQIKDENVVVSEGDGVYNIDGEYVFKGTEVNNYVQYSNILWRIVKVNQDNTVLLVTDEVVNNLVWGNEVSDFNHSNISEWLNSSKDENSGIFENILNDKGKYLSVMSVCADEVTDLKNITCKERSEIGYLGLLSISDYANSVNENSYINNTKDLWLYNISDEKVWNVSEGNITNSTPDNGYGIKPTVTVKNSVAVRSGTGTKDDPYIIEEKQNASRVGRYIEFNGDKWIVYEDNGDMLRLILDELYDDGNTTYKFSNGSSTFDPVSPYTLAYHLNNSIYNSFNYNNVMVDCDWYIGSYALDGAYDYKNIYKEKVTAKVGLYNVLDLKFNNELSDYFYLTPDGTDKVYGSNSSANLYSMRNTYMKPVRPAVCINNGKMTGTGTKDDPYKMEG